MRRAWQATKRGGIALLAASGAPLAMASVLTIAMACTDPGAAPAPAKGTAAPVQRNLDPPAEPGAVAFQLSPGRSGSLLLSWLEPAGADERMRLRVARLRDGGWQSPVTVVEGASFFANWADVPAVAEATDGELVAAWLEKLGEGTYAYGVAIATSGDDGKSWQRRGWLHTDSSETEHGFVSLTAQEEGVRAVWLDGRETANGGAMTLRTALVRDGAVAGERELDERVCDCCSTAVAVVSDAALVAFRDRSETEVRDNAVLRLDAAGAASPARLQGDGWVIPGCPVNGPALAVDGQRAALAWFTGAGEKPLVRAAFSTDGGRTFGSSLLVDGDGPRGRVGLALLADGEAAVSWLGGGDERAAVLLARVGPSGLGKALTVATTGAARASGVPRLLRLDDELYVAWRDDAAGRLHVEVVPVAALPASY